VKLMVCNGQAVSSNSRLLVQTGFIGNHYLLLASSYWRTHS